MKLPEVIEDYLNNNPSKSEVSKNSIGYKKFCDLMKKNGIKIISKRAGTKEFIRNCSQDSIVEILTVEDETKQQFTCQLFTSRGISRISFSTIKSVK